MYLCLCYILYIAAKLFLSSHSSYYNYLIVSATQIRRHTSCSHEEYLPCALLGDLISVCDSVPVRDSWSGSEDRRRDRNQRDFGNEGDFLVKEFQHFLGGPCRKAMNDMTIMLLVL